MSLLPVSPFGVMTPGSLVSGEEHRIVTLSPRKAQWLTDGGRGSRRSLHLFLGKIVTSRSILEKPKRMKKVKIIHFAHIKF